MKQVTLKEAEAILSHNTYSEEVDAKIKAFALTSQCEIFPIVTESFVQDGINKEKGYCTKCHRFSETEGYYSRISLCPHCHNDGDSVRANNSITDAKYKTLILEINQEKGYFTFVSFKTTYEYEVQKEQNNDISFHWLIGEFKPVSGTSVQHGIFMKEKGLRFFGQGKMQTTNTNFHYTSSNKFYNSTFINEGTLVGFFESNDIFTEIKSCIKKLAEKQEAMAEQRASKKHIDVYQTYIAESLDANDSFQYLKETLRIKIDSIGKKYKFLIVCPKCQSIEEYEYVVGQENDVVCSKCGTVVHDKNTGTYAAQYPTSKNYRFMKYELMKETNDLIIRVLDATFSLSANEGFKSKITEKLRLYATPSKLLIFVNDYSGILSKGRANDIDGYYSHSNHQSNEELKEIITKSNVARSGLLDAIGLGYDPKNKIHEPSVFNRSSYLYNWYKLPQLELVIKAGLPKAADTIISRINDMYFDKNSTDVYKLLNIPKAVFKIARKANATVQEIKDIKTLWELDQTLTFEKYNLMRREEYDLSNFIELKRNYNVSYDKAMEYIKSCYDYQCIPVREAMTIWRDYLRMAKDMTYRLENKGAKYPVSLKKEHDKAIFSYKVVADKRKKEMFREASKNNLKYEYSSGKLFVKVPTTPEEVVEEGTNQKHCVASYVNSIQDGRTAIAFLRQKEYPDTAFYTVEIKNEKIVQVKGFTNKAPTEKEVLQFLDKWSNAKKLKLEY